jgi:hypothetical protein
VHAMLLQDIGVTGQAFQHDPRARLALASQPVAAVTRPLHSINLYLETANKWSKSELTGRYLVTSTRILQALNLWQHIRF